MFEYKKFLEYPVRIKNTNPRLANIIITQYGGPHGELGASLRYLTQRYTMPDKFTKGLLTDIGMSDLKCSHTSHQHLTLNLIPLSICVGASLNKHQCPPDYVPLFFQQGFYKKSHHALLHRVACSYIPLCHLLLDCSHTMPFLLLHLSAHFQVL